MSDDKLEQMFDMQARAQKEYLAKSNSKMDIEYVKVMTLACADEIFEALRETHWKPWKKNHITQQGAVQDELVDAFHFFINLCLAHNMTAHELFERFKRKNAVNKERRENNY